jgi:hypothetical protein
MSQTHITNLSGTVICGRDPICGFISQTEYHRLMAEGKIGTRIKTRVKHNCKLRPCDCPRRKSEVSAVCSDCANRRG